MPMLLLSLLEFLLHLGKPRLKPIYATVFEFRFCGQLAPHELLQL